MNEKWEKTKLEAQKRFELEVKNLEENQIRFVDCKNGYTYKVDARNFNYGIFNNDRFYGIRHKFADVFIDEELHWDTDQHHGTVRPQEEIEKTPDYIIETLNNTTDETFQMVYDYLDRFNDYHDNLFKKL